MSLEHVRVRFDLSVAGKRRVDPLSCILVLDERRVNVETNAESTDDEVADEIGFAYLYRRQRPLACVDRRCARRQSEESPPAIPR